MNIRYNKNETYEDSINLTNYGNMCLELVKETAVSYDRYLLITNTSLGYSHIEYIGPLELDSDVPCLGSFTYAHYYMECVENRMHKLLESLINSKGGNTIQINDFSKEQAYQILDSIIGKTIKQYRGAE